MMEGNMVTRFGLIPRRPGLSIEEFHRHWREIHGPLGAEMPGIERYWQNHRIGGVDGVQLPWPGFDGCSEIDASTIQVHLDMRLSDAYLGPIAADEPLLLDRPNIGPVWTHRRASFGAPGEGLRLLTFLRCAPLVPVDEVIAVLQREDRGEGATGREVFASIVGREALLLPSAFDAVDSLWFPHEDAFRAYWTGVWEPERAQLGGLVRGTEHMLVSVHRVVA
jgi:hypothetical protein